MTPKSNRRELVLDRDVWTWALSTVGVILFSPANKKTVVPYHTFLGISKEEWYRIEQDDNSRIAVTPSQVIQYIVNNKAALSKS